MKNTIHFLYVLPDFAKTVLPCLPLGVATSLGSPNVGQKFTLSGIFPPKLFEFSRQKYCEAPSGGNLWGDLFELLMGFMASNMVSIVNV